MNIDEIKEKSFEVDILNQGKEADRLCYMMYNEELGMFTISICDCTSNHWVFPDPENHLYGSVSMESSDGMTHYIHAVLNICRNNSRKACVIFREKMS